ncbi:MAG TPA: molybdopterin-guanine dinucleotide biosynthesis protein B [Acidiphilium sp.]
MRVIGLAGWSGSGKTTLLRRLLPVLIARGLRVSTLKHAHHAFDVDRPGKDSWLHREAGATEVLVSSARRWALMRELREDAEPGLAELLGHMSAVDLVVVEGFKQEPHPKIEIHRKAAGKPPLHPGDPDIVAIASDTPFPSAGIPVLDLDDIDAIAAFALSRALPVESIRWRSPVEEASDGPAHG